MTVFFCYAFFPASSQGNDTASRTGNSTARTSPIGSGQDLSRHASSIPSSGSGTPTAGTTATTNKPDDTRKSDSTAHGPRNFDYPSTTLASLRLPGPGYELDSLPATPTMFTYPPSSPSQALSALASQDPSFSRYPSREITSTPAISSDPIHAFTASMSQGGGFYMNTEDQAKAQQRQGVSNEADEGQLRPTPSFSHTRSFTGESEQDYFSMPSLSSSNSDSSLSFQWNPGTILSPHAKEDSGYGYQRPDLLQSNADPQVTQPTSILDPYAPSLRVRPRPSLRLQEDAALKSLNVSFERNSLTDSSSSSARFGIDHQRIVAANVAIAQLPGNLTPRFDAFWHSESDHFPQSGYQGDQGPTSNREHVRSYSAAHDGRMSSFPHNEPCYGAGQIYDRVLRHSYSVSTLHNFRFFLLSHVSSNSSDSRRRHLCTASPVCPVLHRRGNGEL